MSEQAAYELKLSGSGLADLMQSVLDRGASFRFRARGFSMNPFIRDKDVLTVSRDIGRPVEVGDVVAVINPGSGTLIVHRIVKKSVNGVLIKGDNCSKPDGMFALERIVGVVKTVERNGRAVWFANGPDKKIIAFISRTGLLNECLMPVFRRIKKVFILSDYTSIRKNRNIS